MWYSDKNKTKVVRYDDCGDSAAWTGLYLAALAHKFNVTSDTGTLVSGCVVLGIGHWYTGEWVCEVSGVWTLVHW